MFLPVRIGIPIRLSVILLAWFCSGCSVFEEGRDYSVVPYEGPAFSEADVYGDWALIISSNTYTITGTTNDPDYDNKLVVDLEYTGGDFPSLEDMWFGPTQGGLGAAIKKGRLEVQSWEAEGVLSGVFEYRLSTGGWANARFWIDQRIIEE